MASRDHRKKASEIHRETTYVFSSKVSFAEAFPQIAHVRIEVTETGEGVYAEFQPSVHTEQSMGEFVDCSNSLCYGGGFSVGSLLRDMASKRETHREARFRCSGYEGSPKGRQKYRDCWNRFDVKADIEYKDNESQGGTG